MGDLGELISDYRDGKEKVRQLKSWIVDELVPALNSLKSSVDKNTKVMDENNKMLKKLIDKNGG